MRWSAEPMRDVMSGAPGWRAEMALRAARTGEMAAGLSRAWLAAAVTSVLRLRGHAGRGHQNKQLSEREKAAISASLDAAVAGGRKVRRLVLGNLPLVVKGQPALETALSQCHSTPANIDELVSQLEAAAGLVEQVLGHDDANVRARAEAKRIGKSQADALRGAASAIKAAKAAKGPGAVAAQKSEQAQLDVLDGLCLLLLGEIYASLGTAAELTPKVARPVLHQLRSYLTKSRAKDDAAPVPPQG